MLTRQQWLWLADHHKEVRSWSSLVLLLAVVFYVALMFKATFDKGKAPIPYKPASNYFEQYACKDKLTPLYMGPFGGNTPPKPGYYEDARRLLLEWHYTGMLDVEALTHFPECIGAVLADNINSSNPSVTLLYDKTKGRVVYRIAHLDDVLKR